MSEQLVQIQLHTHRTGARPVMACRPKEVLDLVDALSRMWGRLGVHAICKLCFAGKLGRTAGWGCCGPCPNLGHSRCIDKPIGCATYYCGMGVDGDHPALEGLPINSALKNTRAFLYGWSYDYTKGDGLFSYGRSPFRGYYGHGVFDESTRQWTADELKLLRVARWAVDNWAT